MSFRLLLEVVDDPAEVFAEIQHVEGNVETGRHRPGILGIVDRAAPFVFDRYIACFIEAIAHVAQSHKTANHFMSVLLQQRCSD
jgi:hypothetical protein